MTKYILGGDKLVFNKNITGFENEFEFYNELNNKKFCDINLLLREFLEDLYGKLNEKEIIKCFIDFNKRKYDINIFWLV